MFLMKTITQVIILIAFFLLVDSEILDPKKIPKFVEQIPISSNVYSPQYQSKGKQTYQVKVRRIFQQILPQGYPKTQVFAYGGNVRDRITNKEIGEVFSFPGPQFIFNKGSPAYVVWENQLTGKHLFNVEKNFAFMNTTVIDFENFLPIAPHPHGMTTHYSSDGHPGSWFTKDRKGMNFYSLLSLKSSQSAYYWTNEQHEATLFYHDHAVSMTRLNVYAGLAGFLTIKEPESLLSKSFDQSHDIYLAIFDRSFNKDGSLYYPEKGENKQVGNFTSQFFGNSIIVNGKTWPKMTVKRNQYRIRLLNGCNCRFLNLTFTLENSSQLIEFMIVKVDSACYKSPLKRSSVLLFPSSRAEIVFNFGKLMSGAKIVMRNNIGAPYPMTETKYFDSETTGQVMMFEVTGELENIQRSFPLNQNFNPLLNIYPISPHEPIINKYHVLYEKKLSSGQSAGMYIDGVDMSVDANIFKLGRTYDFYLINLSQDMHPMHFHLVNFQLVKKAKIDFEKYTADWLSANKMQIPFKIYPQIIDPELYLKSKWIYPTQEEKVFRDVYGVQAGYVHVWRIRFSHKDGSMFSFNPKQGQFVWHCHMLEHEDFSMMRHFKVI